MINTNERLRDKIEKLKQQLLDQQKQMEIQDERIKQISQEANVLKCKLEMRDIQMVSFISSDNRKSNGRDNLAQQFKSLAKSSSLIEYPSPENKKYARASTLEKMNKKWQPVVEVEVEETPGLNPNEKESKSQFTNSSGRRTEESQPFQISVKSVNLEEKSDPSSFVQSQQSFPTQVKCLKQTPQVNPSI